MKTLSNVDNEKKSEVINYISKTIWCMLNELSFKRKDWIVKDNKSLKGPYGYGEIIKKLIHYVKERKLGQWLTLEEERHWKLNILVYWLIRRGIEENHQQNIEEDSVKLIMKIDPQPQLEQKKNVVLKMKIN